MTPEDIIHHMAQDFSMHLGDVLGLEDAPADEFFDPISTVFGDEPTESSVINVFRSKSGPGKLANELNSWLEIEQVTPDMAKNLLEVTIVNNFGASALS